MSKEHPLPVPAPVSEVTTSPVESSSAEVVVVAPPVVEQSPIPMLPIPATSKNVRDILSEPVVNHMTSARPLLREDQTVEEALIQFRATEDLGRVIYFYVVDADNHLKGVVAARKLLKSSLDTKLSTIMSTHLITIGSSATVLEACEFFALHKLLAFPVVDSSRKVLGVVDVELYTAELGELERRQESDDLFQLIGVHLRDATQRSLPQDFRDRFPWLLCNVVGGILSAVIAVAYEDISTLVVVAPFIALVTALAESVSIQSVTLALQMQHVQAPQWSSFARKIGYELLIGLLLGTACGVTVGVVAWLWQGSFLVGLSLMLGITGGVVASAAIGFALPFVMKLCQRDPQLASGPIALALSDVVTLLFYFNLGRWLLGR
jgi:magnesium transporter